MCRNVLFSLEIAAVYMGVVIGAGFATGQEIYYFFARFGVWGLAGAALAGLFFAAYGSFILTMAAHYRCAHYRDFLDILMGRRVALLFDVFSFFMLMGGNCVMLAGSGAIFEEQAGIKAIFGILMALFFACLVVAKGLQGLLVANSILVPVKFFSAVTIAGFAIYYYQGAADLSRFQLFRHTDVLLSSILYVSYNLVIPLAVLSSLGKIATKKNAFWGGVLGGMGLGVAAFLITAAEICFYPEIASCQLPLLYVATRLTPCFGLIFGLMIFIAILTALISNTHGIASRLAPGGGSKYRIAGVLALLLVAPLANFEFAFLVRLLYPLFGYAGLIMLLYLTVKMLSDFKNKIYR